jgi:uncharacterized protein DUF6328
MPSRNEPAPSSGAGTSYNIDDLSDMLVELRVLLPGAQLLSAFLITLPFMPTFGRIAGYEKWVFLATFLCSMASLVLLSAPAVQHRLMWPLQDRVAFKRFASFEMLGGAVLLSFALVLGVNLVVSEVFGMSAGIVVAVLIAALLGFFWWLLPVVLKRRRPM